MLRLGASTPIVITIGDVNAMQIVRATIECPAEDQVSVVLDVQGALLDDNGVAQQVIPLQPVRLDPDTAAALYASIRDAIYAAVQGASPLPEIQQSVLSPLVSPAVSLSPPVIAPLA